MTEDASFRLVTVSLVTTETTVAPCLVVVVSTVRLSQTTLANSMRLYYAANTINIYTLSHRVIRSDKFDQQIQLDIKTPTSAIFFVYFNKYMKMNIEQHQLCNLQI